MDRRRLLIGAGALGLAAPALARAAEVQAVPTWKTEFKQLFPNVWAFIRAGGPRLPNPGLSNAGVIVGPDNVTLIDAMGPPIHAHELKRAVQALTPKPVTRVINTHHHRDHTNGDYLFEPAEIVMTPMMARLTAEQGIPAHPWSNMPEYQPGVEELRLAKPTTLISSDVTYMYGDLEVRVLVAGAAHTYGDIMVLIPKHRLLFTGDVCSFYVTPGLHTGDTEHWLTVLDQIQKMDVDVIVPGHGPVGGKREAADLAEYIRSIRDQIRKGYDAGLTTGQAAAAVRPGRFADWGEQERFAWASTRLYAEWRGTVVPEQDVTGQDAALAEYRALVAKRR